MQLLVTSAVKNIENIRPLVHIKETPSSETWTEKMILKINSKILATECNRFAPCVCVNGCWVILNLCFLNFKYLNLKLSLLCDTIYSACGCCLLYITMVPFEKQLPGLIDV